MPGPAVARAMERERFQEIKNFDNEERLMRKVLSATAVVVAMTAIAVAIGTNTAHAKSDKTSKAQLQECKKLADPKMRDECVKRAGKGVEKKENDKASNGTKKGKGKQ
jgi:hypothetical protein